MKNSNIPFEARAHLLKSETAEALARPREFAERLKQAHPARPEKTPKMQIRISGPTVEALETASRIASTTGPRTVTVTKNHADKRNREGALTGASVRIYLNY